MTTKSTKLPKRWTDIDHAIFDARVRRRMTWREVGADVGMSFSAARERFYRRLQAVTPAEVEAMREEENLKFDENERHLITLYAEARQRGEVAAAVSAVRGLDSISRSRRQLNGLDAPQRLEISSVEARSEIDQLLAAFLTGVEDAAPFRTAG
jgi:hypothetical protein